MKVFGIPNCDTVARARKYLNGRGVSYQFCDLRGEPGIDAETIARAYQVLGAATFNTRSPSWRSLDPAQQTALKEGRDFSAAVATPTVLKRPLVFADDQILNGFNAKVWDPLFTAH